MGLKRYILLLFFSIKTSIVFAQLNANIIGNASNQGSNCFIITPDILNQTGGVWYDNPINFSENFTIYYQSNFGSKDFNGADGMAIVFKGNSEPELGTVGGGLSYQGIPTSLIVEFDTWQNFDNSDPAFDHISIMKNGDSNHANPVNNLAGPIQAKTTNSNIEDGNNHEVKIEWLADEQLFEVYFDCLLRLQINLDIKTSIFGGDDSVYFGFVGSTGGSSNLHQVCLNRVSFVDDLQLQDESICEENSVEINAAIASGVNYSWSPTVGISDPNIANPTFFPDETTTYTVTIADVCGDIVIEDVTVSVSPPDTPVFDSIDAICAGEAINPLPNNSNNDIFGFWKPPFNNMETTTYTFVPTSTSCANTATLEIIINPTITPTFDVIAPICEGDVLTALPVISNNGISGSWSPELNNTATTIYSFTPNPNQGCVEEVALEIIVNPINIPLFDFETTVCEGTVFELPTTSNNGIDGIWSPNFDNTVSQEYTFAPIEDNCSVPTNIDITIVPIILPVFDVIDAICEGESIEELPTLSNNGIEGIWSPDLNNTTTTLYTFTPFEGQCAAIQIKEIIVIPEVIPMFNYPITSICLGETLDVLPGESINGITGTWFPELNNQMTTTYTFTPNTNDICVLETTITISVTDPILPVFDALSSICAGSLIEPLPRISNNGISGTWSPEIDTTVTSTYTFTPNEGQCAIQTSLDTEVLPIQELTLDVVSNSEPFANNQSITINVNGGTGNYEYQLDDLPWQIENNFKGIRGCEEHIIKVKELSGCSNVAAETFRILEYPKFFTPNGDTDNEIWNIDCLRDQIGARITIFNRYGKVLATIDPSRFGWNGLYNDTLMPSSDYWFKAEYKNNDGSSQTFVSHFSLKR